MNDVRLGRYRRALQQAISSESKAYGFTLVVWGTAAMVTSERGLPGRMGTVAYLGGLLVGMAVVVLLVLGGPTSRWRTPSQHPRRLAAGAIHAASVAAAVAAGWGCAALFDLKWLAYLTAGAAASVVYQFVLGLEVAATIAGDDDAGRQAWPSPADRPEGRTPPPFP